jgi:4-diphosphocytidyl-2-C-methyl-D-erythritol kinase
MIFNKIRSHAKINLALNIVGKNTNLHRIESIISFTSLHDEILIKKIKANKHRILFFGEFSKGIKKENTISKLMQILEKRKLLNNQKFMLKIKKKIPNQAGLGGGSMNAASVLKFFLKKKIITISKEEILKICNLIGSDVILGLNSTNSILTSKNKIKVFKDYKKLNILIVKPNYGCSTQEIYSKVNTFNQTKFDNPTKKMFKISFLKKNENQLESIVFSKYPKLKLIKLYIEKTYNPLFIRMTGSGSALVAYFESKEKCEKAKKKFIRKYKNYWCISSKTI